MFVECFVRTVWALRSDPDGQILQMLNEQHLKANIVQTSSTSGYLPWAIHWVDNIYTRQTLSQQCPSHRFRNIDNLAGGSWACLLVVIYCCAQKKSMANLEAILLVSVTKVNSALWNCFFFLFFFGLVIVSITPSPGRLLKLDAWASEWQPFNHLPAFSRLQSTLWINLAFQTLYITTVPGLQYHCKKYNTSIQTVLLLHLSLMGIIVHDPLSSNIHFIAPVKLYSICDNCVT